MKAMILAAGLGKRMCPLTLTTPKPLLQIGNTTLIDHALSQLQKAGISEVVINVHHLREKIIQHCGDGSKYNLKIYYSIEETLLETGGGIFQALPLLGDEPFLILSAYVWTDYPLEKLLQKKTNSAHLVFVDNPNYNLQGDYNLDENGIVHDNLSNKLTYANIGILNPAIFHAEKPGIFRLFSVLKKFIAQGVVTGEYYSGVWHNVGTPQDLLLIQKFL